MILPPLRLTGARVLTPEGWAETPLTLSGGQVVHHDPGARDVDLTGCLVLPGIVDAHGDGFERHLAPRRGAMKDLDDGMIAAGAELAANGITTAVLAQFYSWEGGMRGPEFAARVLSAVDAVRGEIATDLRMQLRLETHMLDDFAAFEALRAKHDVGYVVFNDHLPHDKLAAGKRPPRLTGQALKSGRNPDRHHEIMQALHARSAAVPAALDALAARLAAQGVRMGSHDDRTAADRAAWRARGVAVAEFPETLEAAEAARDAGEAVVLGAPNVVRGGSHNGNASAIDLIATGCCDALASDYHYPSLRRAAFMLADCGLDDLAGAWARVSSGPARVLGLDDRGTLAPGMRADLVVLDAATRRIGVTIAGGRAGCMAGGVAARFLG
ncbi:alpha-D-ribose 1-methylphosphonate 5-triphosphate diphosphatase [Roseovarius salinarum]|uniref:alpha-D-ribose 1-methylphosphonate 5-triphosphate diphosphatase n=1 Tax=Roseovarius salinarum TaxID=1981892 RepID=UPI000C325F30|nr:alpha-D-ribose 1-methylphosphonate 5-triphosphate diphosphatase [Roseovarius salinarum]